MSVKLKIARAQLGTALGLFIKDRDPLSVQALACGGSEIMEGLEKQNRVPALSSHILKTYPDMDMREIHRLKNQYWNAIKHFYNRDNQTAREDEALMSKFSDVANDAILFMGWLDYQSVTKRLPIEVQVFQVWWYATNEGKLNPATDPRPFRSVFPEIMSADRKEQKRRLARVVEKYRRNSRILSDPRTEPGQLIISN